MGPAPQPLPEDAHVIDNHTHVASVVPFSQAMSHEAMEKGQGEVPVYSVDELLEQAQKVGVEGVIDCGCELPNLMTAIDMAREHPGTVHAAIAIHPNEAVLHGHRGAPAPMACPSNTSPGTTSPSTKPWPKCTASPPPTPTKSSPSAKPAWTCFVPANPPRNCNARRSAPTSRSPRNSTCPCKSMTATRTRKSSKRCSPTEPPERTVFHSYSGDAEMGEIARENGWYLSLSGTSSYKGNDGIRESAKLVGMSHVMVETDAPYLSPMPYRGRTNAPYMIPYTLQALADYLDRPLAEIAKATRETTREVYGI